MNNNIREEIQRLILKYELAGERMIDILLEIQRIYQLDASSFNRLLTKKQKEKLKRQEIKYNNIKE